MSLRSRKSKPHVRWPSPYTYPNPPSKLELFSTYGYIERPKTAGVDYLEHMLSKTSLSTQKLAHSDIQRMH